MVVVRKGAISETVQARGQIAAAREQPLFFRVGGHLRNVYAVVGDKVAQGALVAELDTQELEFEVLRAQNDLEQARLESTLAKQEIVIIGTRVEVEQKRVERATTIRDRRYRAFQKYEYLGPGNDNYDDAVTDLERAEQALEDALLALRDSEADQQRAKMALALPEYRVALKQAVLRQAQEKLAATKLSVPFSGVLLSLGIKPGDAVNPYQEVATLADPSRLLIQAHVFETDVRNVASPQAASVVLDNAPQTSYSGKVRQVASTSHLWQGKPAYLVSMDLDNPAQLLSAVGVGADVTIVTRIRRDVLLVPTRAIITDGKTSYVEVLQEGSWNRVPLTLGVSSPTETEVASGLQEGDTVRVP